MAGTINGWCYKCDCEIDYDPLLGGKQFCDDCIEEDKRMDRADALRDEEKENGVDEVLAEKAGLTYMERNSDGEVEYIGTDKQWKEFERLKSLNNLI